MEGEKISDMGKIGFIQGVLKGIIDNHSHKFSEVKHTEAIQRAKEYADELGDSLMRMILQPS